MGQASRQWQKHQNIRLGLIGGLLGFGLIFAPTPPAMAVDTGQGASPDMAASNGGSADDAKKSMNNGPKVIQKEDVRDIEPVAPREPVRPRE